MPDAVMIQFGPAVTAEIYDQVNARVNPPGSPPAGLIFHFAGPTADGGWRVVDVWDSRDSFDRFWESEVGPAVAEVVGPDAQAAQGEPPSIESWPVHHYALGAA